MEKKSSLWNLALAATFTVLPGVAFAQETPSAISGRLMDAIEAWSSPALTYEDLALEEHPELLDEYVPVVETHYRGRTLGEVFAEQLPATTRQFGEATGGELDSASELLAFSLGSDEYARWQESLRGSAADFTTFVETRHPEVKGELAEANITPAERGIGLLDFVNSLEDPLLFDEAIAAIGTVKKTVCTCRTFVAFPEVPYPWTQQVDHHDVDNSGFIQHQIHYTVWGRGVARNIDYSRYTKNQLLQETWNVSANTSSLRIRMVCVRQNEQLCDGPCKGDVVVRAGYASRVYEQHDVAGIWSKEAQALSADYAKLTYTGPAALGPTLFEKGVAVSGQYQSGWNSGAIANTLFAVGNIALNIATDNAAAALTSDLINPLVQGIGGLVTHSGSTGSTQRDMQVTWENLPFSSNPIYLFPNQTHLFEMSAQSEIYSRGYGKKSWTWSNVDSGLFLFAIGRNYQCGANVVAPTNRAYWLQVDNSSTVYNSPTLQNQLLTFIQVELGVSPNPSLLTPTVGAYP